MCIRDSFPRTQSRTDDTPVLFKQPRHPNSATDLHPTLSGPPREARDQSTDIDSALLGKPKPLLYLAGKPGGTAEHLIGVQGFAMARLAGFHRADPRGQILSAFRTRCEQQPESIDQRRLTKSSWRLPEKPGTPLPYGRADRVFSQRPENRGINR